MKRNTLIIILVSVCSLLIYTWRKTQAQKLPIRVTGQGIPDGSVVGNVEDSMQRMKKLLSLFRDNNWKNFTVLTPEIRQLIHLPDAKYSENTIYHDPRFSCVTFITSEQDKDLAIYTDIYARQNRAYFKGDRSQAKPSGFFIVGYKNGTIQKVPVSRVRRKAHPRAGENFYCFPEMSCYSTSVPDPSFTTDPKPK